MYLFLFFNFVVVFDRWRFASPGFRIGALAARLFLGLLDIGSGFGLRVVLLFLNIDAICGTGKTRGGGSGGSAIGPFKTGGRLFRIFIGIMGIGPICGPIGVRLRAPPGSDFTVFFLGRLFVFSFPTSVFLRIHFETVWLVDRGQKGQYTQKDPE